MYQIVSRVDIYVAQICAAVVLYISTTIIVIIVLVNTAGTVVNLY